MSRRAAAGRAGLALAACLLLGGAAGQGGAASAERDAQVVQPRAYGYVLGDVLEQRVLLESEGRRLEPAAVPVRERIGAWFERRAARIEADAAGRPWLVVQYQVFNVQPNLGLVQLPPWRLALKGDAPAALRVPAWPVSLAPMTPREGFDDYALGALRPEREPSLPDRHERVLALRWSALALALELLAWLGWWRWRNWRAAQRLPFARALRQLRGLDEASPQAWQVLHGAFDRAAGRALHLGSLPALFERLPYLAAARAAIERFYQQSALLFFGAGLPPDALSVRALAVQLQRLERSHEQ